MPGPRVVVIGAGVVGAALADELALRGWDQITVVDQGTVPAAGGSSSHAPGLVFQANSSRTMTQLATYTVDKLMALSTDEGPAFLPGRRPRGGDHAGARGRAAPSGRLADRGRGRVARSSTPPRPARRYPLLDPDVVLGGLFTPDRRYRQGRSRGSTRSWRGRVPTACGCSTGTR